MRRLNIMLTVAVFFSLTAQCVFAQNVGINNDGSLPDPSAGLDVKFTNKGFLPPRMTSAQVKAITSPAEGLIVYDTDLKKPLYYDGTGWKKMNEKAAYPPEVGDFYDGGAVFYILKQGDPGYVVGETHGLICSVNQTQAIWGCRGTTITGADGLTVGTGAQNTIDIENGCTAAGTAADFCANLIANGYDDWYLPSRDELALLYENRTIINVTLGKHGGEGIYNVRHWSSSEGTNNPANAAYMLDFSNNVEYQDWKNNTIRTLAIRAF